MIKSLLEGKNIRRDFPYNGWPNEHDIINAPAEEAIILLGRSGTGKTTCCLYRMWNHFQTYWSETTISDPRIPQTPLLPSHASLTQKVAGAAENAGSGVSLEECESDIDMESPSDEQNDHLHQIFITKNYVLCAQMKKHFYNLAAGCDIAEAHMKYEDKELPHSLSRVEELAYPLFLTARQFFILLDNSLGTEATFFPREDDGSLKVEIFSSDYDHEDPDTLIDLEESSTESEDEGELAFHEEFAGHQATSKKQQKEVTASYFVEKMWPKIAHKCTYKNMDPILVWTEIKTFIKGSRQALESSCGYITVSEYEELGRKKAPNFKSDRKEIYRLFEEYQCLKSQQFNLFDECDFIHHVYTRLKEVATLPWSIHYFYVDEVQDFTEAELTVLLACCRQPNGFFLTGDTAQSIMRGISFRFSDLRSLFYHRKEETKGLKGAARVQVPDLKKLTINFRSHSGILKLAVSIIELMKEFFPTSFDADLPNDEGMFSGRTPPVLLQSCSSSDLAVVLQGNKRESSQIEFGAHQAIIVQNQEAKKNLPNELQGGIALTIFESKGLEFDDILLYNFFKDSKVSDIWRVATSFLEHNHNLVKNSATDFCLPPPRSLEFDETQHKSLNGELKYLYTAITRARCNLWIYDEDGVRRLPMFDYWSKRGLVKVVRIEDVTEEDLFTVTSTPEEWKERGDYFKKKRLWEAAVKCYSKAGTESLHLEMEAKAYLLAQEAHKSKKKEEGYLRAAVGFLECDQQHHSLTCLGTAARCIKNAKMYGAAARLFEKMLEYEQAIKAFMKARELENCVRILQKLGKHDTAVKLLMRANHKEKAVNIAADHIKDLQVDTTARVTQLAYFYANTYAQQNDREKLLHIKPLIQGAYLIQLLKKVGLHEHACEILIQQKQYEEAFQLLTARGIFKRGILLAKQQNNNKMLASFVLRAAEAEIISNGEITDPDILEYLVQFKSDQHIDPLFKAKANLLLGKSKSDAKLCQLALELYKDQKNMTGEVESFSTLAKIQQQEGNPMNFLKLAVKALKVLRETCNLLDEQLQVSLTKARASSTQCKRQTEDFYSLQKVEGGYLFPPNQHLWIDELDKCIVSDESHPDGMTRLDVSKTLNAVLKHLKGYELKWVERIDNLRRMLQSKLESFTFHAQLQQGFLTRSFMFYTEKQLKEYLELCITALETLEVSEAKETSLNRNELKCALTSLFSPSVFPHLRLCQETHFPLLKKSSLASKLLQNRVNKLLFRSKKPITVDNLLEAWRILSALGRRLNELECTIQWEVEQAWRDLHSPLRFVCVKQAKNQHYFSSWLQVCQTIREGDKMNGAIKLTLQGFVQIIARRRSLRTISVANLVDILTTTTTALFAILSHCRAARRQHLPFYIPHTFEHTLQVFNGFNCSNSTGKSVLDACAQTVQEMRDLLKLEDDAFRSLWDVLDILVGKYNQWYNALSYAMGSADNLKRGDTQQCLILVLTLFGNLAIHYRNAAPELTEYQHKIYDALGPLAAYEGTQAQLLKQVWSEFTSTNHLFRLVHKLLRCIDKDNATLKKLEFVRGSTHLKINDIPVHRIPKCHLLLMPQDLHVHNPPAKLNTVPKVLQIPQTTSSQQHSVHPSFEQLITTPSHPATAQPTATITALAVSIDETESHTSAEGHDNLSPFTSQMTQPIIVSPSQSENQTHSVTETQPPTTEYPSSVKEDQSLPEKQLSQLPPSHSIARMISAEEPEDIENEEIETDEDIQEILAAYTEEKPLPLELEQQMSVEEDVSDQPDSSQVDENFCSICAVPLKKLSSDPLDNVEAYKPHIQSEKHKRQEKLCAEFTHKVEDKFNSAKDKLLGILDECNSVDNPSPSLLNFISAAQKEIKGDKQTLEQIKDRAEWELGLSEVEMLGRLASLMKKGEAELQMTQDIPQEHHVTEADAYFEEAQSDLDEDPIEKATPENMKNQKAKRRKQKKQKRRPKR